VARRQSTRCRCAEIRERHERARDDYLRFERELLGWAIFVGKN